MYAQFLEDRVSSYIPFTQISYIISEIYKQRNKMNSTTYFFSNFINHQYNGYIRHVIFYNLCRVYITHFIDIIVFTLYEYLDIDME